MSDYISADIRCPFYRDMERQGQKIICEGLEDRSSIILAYRKKQMWMRQMNTFCCGRYEACEIYQAIMQAKYLDD